MNWIGKLKATGIAALALAVVAGAIASQALGGSKDGSPSSSGLGALTGLLPRDHLTEESAIQVDLSKESVRLPLYKGEANGQTVWYVLLDASDPGIAHDLGVNYAPKLSNIAIGNPDAVQTVTLDSPTPDENKFGQALVHFQGAPDFSPTRIAEPGPTGFPLAKFQPGAVAGPGYSPFIRIAGSPTVYSAPIVATGDGPFDVVHHTNTGDRVLGVHIAGPSAPGQFAESWVDLLFVKGFDAGQPIVYISTDAGQPLTSVLERSTYVPALDKAAYNGGDDFLGSARERLFGFINGQTGADNKQSQGFVHLIKDGHASEDASASNTALIDALRNGGDLLNVFGDFPTLSDPRHADAYSPLWDAQLGLWTDKAVQQGLNTRQTDEVQVFNLAATRPDLITGINPATGQPAPYGATGVDINCAVIGFIDKAPTANLASPAPNSQFPPR
ncbi:MAG: hypothetical protein QOD48_2105 [Gaiellaceae bacterium]|jgi:hypothetical protein|nr:hypothetical protein [Gaiellaceae bacterium]